MSRSYSLDLRTRLMECVAAGASRHEVAERFGVSVSSAVHRGAKAKTMFETSVASIRIWLGGARTRAQLADERAAQETRRAEAKTAEDAHRAAEAKADADARFAAEAKAAEEAHRTAEAKAAEEARRTAEAKAAEDARRAAVAKATKETKHLCETIPRKIEFRRRRAMDEVWSRRFGGRRRADHSTEEMRR
jgi:hypothetical protein